MGGAVSAQVHQRKPMRVRARARACARARARAVPCPLCVSCRALFFLLRPSPSHVPCPLVSCRA